MIRVYEYGCLRPLDGLADAVDQIYRRNRLWNSLVEVEQRHRQEAAKLLSDPTEQTDIQHLMERLATLRQEIKERRKTARSKKVDVPDLRDEINTIKAELGIKIDAAKLARKERVTYRREQLDELNQERRAQSKRVTHEAGLYWCNYDEVVSNYETARRRPGGELKFHRFNGEGKVTVRYQNGLLVEQAFGG